MSLTNLSGSFTDTAGSYTGTVTGTLSASAGSADVTGTASITFDNADHTLSLSGTSDAVTIGNQAISGNFGLADDGSGDVDLSASNVTVSLGNGLVDVTNGAFAAAITPSGITGSMTGTVAAGTAGSVQFTGPISVTLTSDSIAASSAAGVDTLTVAGKSFSAGFAFSEDNVGDLDLAVSDVNFSLGGGVLAVSNAAGQLVVSPTGVSGAITAALTSTIAHFSGNLGLTYGSGSVTVTASNVSLSVGNNSLAGSVTVTTDADGTDLDLSANGITASLGGGLVTVTPAPAGSSVPPTTLKIHNGAVTGSFSGVVTAGSAEIGAGFSGLVSVSVGSGDITATGTGDTLTVGGTSITADFNFHHDASGNLLVSVANVSFSLGSLLSVAHASGDLTVAASGVTGNASGTITKGIGNLSGDLAVSFAPGSIQLSGTNDSLSYGDQSLSGSFVFSKNASGLHLSSSNLTASLGGGLVTVNNGSATLSVDGGTGAVSGSFSGAVTAGSALSSSGTGFAGTLAVTLGGGAITASGTNDTLTVAGTPFTASFNFFENAAGLELKVSGLSFTLGSVISVSGASGTLTVNSTGIVGSTTGTVSSALVGFSGTLGVAFGNGEHHAEHRQRYRVAGRRAGDDQRRDGEPGRQPQRRGDRQLQRHPRGGNRVERELRRDRGRHGRCRQRGGQRHQRHPHRGRAKPERQLRPNRRQQTATSLDLTMSNAALSIGSVLSITNASGTVNVSSTGVTGTITGTLADSIAGLTATSFGINFAPGLLDVSAAGAALNIGGQSVGGDFEFTKNASGIQLTSSDLTASLGGGLVTVNNGSGTLSVTPAGVVSGTFSGVVAAGSASNLSLGGNVSVAVTPGSITASGTSDTLVVGGYTLTTNFNFSDDAQGLHLSVDHLNFSLGSALSIANATGSLLVTSAGVSGTAAGAVSTNFTGVSISGNLGVTFGGGSVSVSGTNDLLTAGSESISGNFTFTKNANGLELTSSNFAASLGGGLVTVTNGSGDLTVGSSAISGSFAGTIAAGTVGGGVSFNGPIAVSVGGGTITASTPAGQADTISIAGQSVSAGFAFTDSSSGLTLALSDVNVSLGGGAVTLSGGSGNLAISSAGVTGNAAGTLASSFNGFSFTGTLAASFAPGSLTLSGTNDLLTAGDQSIGGNFSFSNSGGNVQLSAGDFTASLGNGLVTVNNGSGHLTITNGVVSGGFSGTVAAGTAGAGFSGAITVNLAPGSITASGVNDTLTVGSQTVRGNFNFSEDSSGLELALSDVNLALGSGIIAVNNAGGTVHVTHSGVSGNLYGGLAANVPNVSFAGSNFGIAFGNGSTSVSGTGVNLTAYGQSIGGNFSFTQSGGSVALAISNLSLSLGGVVNVTNGTGNFTLTSGIGGGMTGSASGNVSIAGNSNVSFGGNYSVAVGNGAVSVSGTGDTANLYGQSLSGNFNFTDSAGNVDLHASALNLSLGGGLVKVSGGAADFNIAAGNITGSASGQLSVGSSEGGVAFSGLASVSVGSGGVTVTGTGITVSFGGITATANVVFTKDTGTGALDVAISNLTLVTDSSSPSVVVSGTLQVLPTGMSGTLVGHGTLDGVNGTITATFANGTYSITAGVSSSFSENLDGVAVSGTVDASGTTGSAGSSGSIELTNLMVSLGNGLLQINGGTASLNEVGGKLSGTVDGSVSLNGVNGVSISGEVAIAFAPGSITVTGTNDSVTVLNQTLAGNFAVSDGGNGTVDLGVSNLSLALGDTVSISNGTANFVLGGSGNGDGIKGTGSATVALNVPGVSFGGAFGLNVDNTHGNNTFTFAANPVTITVGNESLTGAFAFQKVSTRDGTTHEALVASGISVYLGDGSTGLQITNAGGAVLIEPTGVAMDIHGTAALVGITGLTLGGTLDARFNNTGTALDETVAAPDPANPGQTISQELKFAVDENAISGTATLAISNGSGNTFVSLTGGFSVSEVKTTSGGVTTTKLLIGAAGLNAFLGSGTLNADGTAAGGSTGVEIQNANLGLVIVGTQTGNTHTSSYALSAGGAASLVGVSGLTLSGTLAVQSDTAGAITQEIDVPDPQNPGSTIPVNINFTGNTQAFAGTGLTLAVASGGSNLVSLTGNFSFTKNVAGGVTTISLAAQNVGAFVGYGGVGLQLSGGELGLLLIKNGTAASTVALDASGNVSLVGLPGLNVSGALAVDLNTTGSTQTSPADNTRTIPIAATAVVQVNGLTFAVVDSSNHPVLSATVNATISKLGGDIDLNATSADLQLNVAGTQVFDLQGTADFTLGSDGFNVGPNGYSITNFSILGGTLGASPTSVATPSTLAGAGAAAAAGGIQPVVAPTLPTGTPRKLGPLSVYGLKPILKGFGFKNDTLTATVGLQASAATLNFGSSGSNGGTQAVLTGLAGSFQLAVGVDPSALKVTSFGGTGKFDISATDFVLNVPNVVNASAQNIDISYNPQASSSQQIISIGTATVTVPIGSQGNGISGQISPYTDPSTGATIPGLVVYGDHFQLGTATVQYNGTLSFSSFAKFVNPFVTITNLAVNYSTGLSFNGGITIGASEVTLGPSSFQFTGTGVAATLTHTGGNWGFNFTANSLGATLGPVALSASDVAFNPDATGSEPLVSFNDLSASLTLSKLSVTGQADSPDGGSIVIDGDGTLSLPNDFSIGFSVGAGSSGALGWPTWLPIQVSNLVLTWPDFNDDKTDFTITFSASMNANYGGIVLQGNLTNVTVDVEKLEEGEFPITGIQSGLISATGNAFGGQVSGTLVLGVIHLDAQDHAVAYGAAYDHSIFYAGIEGSVTTPEGGIGIRFGLTQNGPLQAYVDIQAPLEIFPPADLAITQLYGGITFDAAPLPTISSAIDLENAVFAPGYDLTTAQWEIQLQQETINQAGGGSGGYLFTVSSGVAGIANDLDAGTADAALAQDFLDEANPLSGSTAIAGTGMASQVKTTVKVESPGQEWLIVDGSNFYVITKNQQGTLDVTKAQFAIDNSHTGADGTVGGSVNDIVADLNAGTVSDSLVQAFAAYRIGIDSTATITAGAPASVGAAVTSWTIRDNGYVYSITQDGAGVLVVLASGGSMSSMNSTIQIEAAVTLGFGGTDNSGIAITGDIIIDTDGKVLLNAYVDMGAGGGGSDASGEGFNFRAYLDFSQITAGAAKTYFLFQQLINVPGYGSLPELTIAAGATFAQTDAQGDLIIPGGPYADATPDGFGIALDGQIIVEPVPNATLTLTGEAEVAFFSNHATLTFDAALSANIENFLQADNVVTAAGSFTFQYGSSFQIWGAAELIFDGGAIPFLEDAGIQADAIFFLRLNTDPNNSHSITFNMPTPGQTGSYTPTTIDLQPSSFGLYAVGKLSLDKGPIDLTMEGVFDIDFEDVDGNWQFDMFAFAQLDLGVDGQTLLSLDGLGLFQINNDGLAAMLAINTTADSSILKFEFNFDLYLNTTSTAVTYTVPQDLVNIIEQVDLGSFSGDIDTSGNAPSLSTGLLADMMTEIDAVTGHAQSDPSAIQITIPAGLPTINEMGQVTGYAAPSPYLIIQGHGDLEVLNAITFEGDVQIQATPDGVGLSVNAELDMGPIAVAASGVLDLTSSGIVAAVSLGATLNFQPVASLFAAATLEINTTGEDQVVKEYSFDEGSGTISTSPVDHTILGSQILAIDAVGKLTILGSFSIYGSFYMQLNSDSLLVAVDAHINAFFGGVTLDVDGFAEINSNGSFLMSIAANVSVSIPHVFEIDGTATVEINTTGSTQNVSIDGAPTVTIAPGADIALSADVYFLHFGSFSLFQAHIIGDATYNSATNVFTVAFMGATSINLFIFDATLNFGGWIDSTGQFAVGVSGGFGLNFGIGSISGNAFFGIAFAKQQPTFDRDTNDLNPDWDAANVNVLGLPVHKVNGVVVPYAPVQTFTTSALDVEGHIAVSGSVLGIGIGIDADVSFNSGSGELTVHCEVDIKIIFVTIPISVTIHLGSMSGSPPSVTLAGVPSNPSLTPGGVPGGVLVLNVGNLAHNRDYDDSDLNENVLLTADPMSGGTQNVYVTVDGYTQEYTGVTKVVIPATGGDTIEVANSVAVPLNITAGGNGNGATIIDAGSGNDTITGGPGNDTIEAGSGNDVINGNGGNDLIIAGAGNDRITTGSSGASQILWNADQDGALALQGGDGEDELVATFDTPATNYAAGETIALASKNNGTSTLTGSAGHTATVQGVPNLILNAPGGGNTLNVGDMHNSGIANLGLDYGSTHSGGDALNLTGSSGNDTITASSGSAALPTLPSAPTPVSGNVGDATSVAAPSAVFAPATVPATGNNVQTVLIDDSDGFNVTLYGATVGSGDTAAINSNGGNDAFNVQSVVIPTTVQGDATGTTPPGDSTYYYVGAQPGSNEGTLSDINSTLTIDGSAGDDDIVVLEDQADSAARTYDLTASQAITDATGSSGKIFYNAGIDNLDLDAGPGANNYVIKSTGASTLTQILTGNSDNHFVVNGPLADPLAIDGGPSLTGQNTLTVNGSLGSDALTISPGLITGAGADIYYANLQGLTLSGNGGNDAFTLNGNLIPVTLLGSAGNDVFTLNGNSAPVSIDGGAGTDAFTVNGTGAPMTITGEGSDTYTVNGNGASLNITGGSGVDVFNVNANTATMNLTGGTGKSNFNTFNILANSGTLNVTSHGSSTYNIANTASPVTINGQSSQATYFINGPLAAPLTIVGSSTLQNLVITGTVGDDDFLLTPTQILGVGAPITYSGFLSVTVDGGGGDDTFTVQGNAAATTINASGGNATFNVEAVNNALTINNDNGAAAVNLGNPDGMAGDLLGGINALVTVNGSGVDTLSLNDTADNAAQAGTLSATAITGMGLGSGGAVDYSGLALLDATLGNGDQTITVSATNAATAVNLSTGSGDDTITVQGNAAALNVQTNAGTNTLNVGNAGSLGNVTAPLSVDGGGHGTLNLDDTADTTTHPAGTLTATQLTGFNTAGITYTGDTAVNLALGNAGNTLTIASTAPAAATAVTGGSGNDTFAVQSTAGPTTITTGSGTNAVTVGDTLADLQGPLTVQGAGVNTLTLNDTADTSATTGTLTATQLTGENSAGVNYADVATLNVNLGSGDDTFTIAQTAAATNLVTGPGNDTVNVLADSNATLVNVGLGTNTVNVGTTVLAGITAPLSIAGGGTDTLNLTDTGTTAAQTLTVSATAATVATAAPITFGGDLNLAALNISLGSGGNTVAVNDTPAAAVTTINTGSGNDSVTVSGDTGVTHINTQAGDDTVVVQGTSAATTLNTGTGVDTVTLPTPAGVQAAVNVKGNAADTLTVNDSSDTLARGAIITANQVLGLGMTGGVSYTGVGTLNVDLSSAGTALTVVDTAAGTVTNITAAAAAADNITVQHDSGTTNLTAGTGATTLNLQGTGAATNLTTTPGGADAVTVGNAGSVAGITGLVTLAGNGTDTLLVDDSADAAATHATLNATQLQLAPAAIHYTGVAGLTVNLGTAADTLTIADTAAATGTTVNGGTGNDTLTLGHNSGLTTLHTGAGANTVNVQTTGAAATIVSAPGATNTVDLGLNGNTDSLLAPLTLTGNGADNLTIDDSTNAAAKTVTVNAAAVTGISPAAIAYTHAATLTVKLGTAPDTATVADTSATTLTRVFGGVGSDTFVVQNDHGITQLTGGKGPSTVHVNGTTAPTSFTTPAGSTAAIMVGNAGLTSAIDGPVTINGAGSDSLTVDDSADASPANVTLAAATISGASPAAINYGGLSNLMVDLGSGGNNITVANTAAATTLDTGAGDDVVSVQGTTAPLSINTGAGDNSVDLSGADGTLSAITGVVTVTGNGFDQLNVDDSGDPLARAGVLNAATVTGLSPAAVNYTGVQNLTLSLGSGSNTLSVASTGAGTSTTISAGPGIDAISVGGNGRLASIAGPLALLGTGSTIATLDDAGNTSPAADALTAAAFAGATATPIAFNGLASLDVLLGSGGNQLTVSAPAAGNTTLHTGSGDDTVILAATTNPVTVQSGTGVTSVVVGDALDAMAGPIHVDGNGTTGLNVNDTGSSENRTAVLSDTLITGLTPAPISYAGLRALDLTLGSGADALTVNATAAGTATAVDTTAGADAITVQPAGDSPLSKVLQGPLSLSGAGADDSITVNDSADIVARVATLTATTLGGLGGPITFGNAGTVAITLGTSNDSLDVTGLNANARTSVDGGAGSNAAGISLAGDFDGNLSLTNFQGGSVHVAGNMNGSLSTDGNLNTVEVGGNVSPTSSLSVAGNLASLSVAGADQGTVTAGSNNANVITNATPDADGVVFSFNDGGVTRSVLALSATGQPLVGVTFDVVYSGNAAAPVASISVNNADPAHNRFDLVLQADGTGQFDLGNLTSATNGPAGVRNVAVAGDLSPGAIRLPSDHLAAVSVAGNLAVGSIDAASIEGIGFGTFTDVRGRTHKAGSLFNGKAVLCCLSVNPATGRPYAALIPVSDPLRAVVSGGGSMGLYAVMPSGHAFDPRGMILSSGGSAAVSATVSYGEDLKHNNVITDLQLTGDLASVMTGMPVGNVVSDGVLGNLLLKAGRAQSLQSLTAPSIAGNVNLFGGTLTGVMQTTGVRIDGTTGATRIVPADLGTITGHTATVLRANLGTGAMIVSRGNLLSHVQVDGPLLGTIAAAGDIGQQHVSGISVGRGRSTGQVLALGNVLGDVTIVGPFTGTVSARGQDDSAEGVDAQGVLGTVRVHGNVVRGGSVNAAADLWAGMSTAGGFDSSPGSQDLAKLEQLDQRLASERRAA